MYVTIGILILIIIYYFSLKKKQKDKLKDKYGDNWLIQIRKERGFVDEEPPIDQSTPLPKGFTAGNLVIPRPGTDKFDNTKMYGNHERDGEGTRMMRGWWPEFKWPEYPLEPDNDDYVYTRVVQDISRLLYNDKGEILSFICPQRGQCIKYFGCVRLEVTVSDIKGWVNEEKKTAHGYFKGYGTVWIDEYDKKSKHDANIIKLIKKIYPKDRPLPFSKENGIIIPYYRTDADGSNTDLTEFKDNNNIQPNLHPEAYMVISLSAIWGSPVEVDSKFPNHRLATAVNKIIVEIASRGSRNMFEVGTILTWDIYLTKPELVDKKEYMKHVEKMKLSYELCDEKCGPAYISPTINEYGVTPQIPYIIISNAIIRIKNLRNKFKINKKSKKLKKVKKSKKSKY